MLMFPDGRWYLLAPIVTLRSGSRNELHGAGNRGSPDDCVHAPIPLQPHIAESRLTMKRGFGDAKKEIGTTQVQQESGPGSTHRDASHALRQAQGEKPQAGYCDRSLEGASEGRQGSTQESRIARANALTSRAPFLASFTFWILIQSSSIRSLIQSSPRIFLTACWHHL